MVYGSTLGFLTLGLYTDFIARGRNLYTLLAVFIAIQFLYILVFTIYDAIFGVTDFNLKEKISIGIFGYTSCLTSVLQLQSIPLYIAGRYRDLNSAWELPLAG